MLIMVLLALASAQKVFCGCYFSQEFQGEFVTQSHVVKGVTGQKVKYHNILVSPTGIPIWGDCHTKRGNNVILREEVGQCFRCFRLELRSENIIQVHVRDEHKCFTDIDSAIATCPTHKQIYQQHVKEFILYRVKDGVGEARISEVYCPINGRFDFSYSLNAERGDGKQAASCTSSSSSSRCSSSSSCSSSKLSNCPYGFGLSLEYRGCTFPDHEVSFQCLGDWEGLHGERYLALLDTRMELEGRPKYRCGLYREEAGTGVIYMAMSSDSTCSEQLYSSGQGYETYKLNIKPTLPWPPIVRKTSCQFPQWTSGHWEDMFIQSNTLVFKDRRNFKTYSSQCVKQSHKNKNRFLIYARTQCGEDLYNCVWFNYRGPNIMEFQLGLRPSQTPSLQLCDNDHFLQRTWHTQGRAVPSEAISCPIAGEYVGVLPDAPGLCAKMSSDCNNPTTMFYTVTDCADRSHVYQDRAYECLGQWEEDGLLYTYTRRKDIPGYECFVAHVGQDGRVSLAEGGQDCKRGMRVNLFGMKLTKRRNCYGQQDSGSKWYIPPTRSPDDSRDPNHNHRSRNNPYKVYRDHISTRPWSPILGRDINRNKSPGVDSNISLHLVLICYFYHLFYL